MDELYNDLILASIALVIAIVYGCILFVRYYRKRFSQKVEQEQNMVSKLAKMLKRSSNGK